MGAFVHRHAAAGRIHRRGDLRAHAARAGRRRRRGRDRRSIRARTIRSSRHRGRLRVGLHQSDAGGQQTTTVTGTLGTDATVTYQPAYPDAPNDLRYYCTVHGNGMGNTITMNNPNTIQQQTSSTSTSQSNPYGTPDPTAEFKRQIFTVDRKSTETREVVEFELAAPTDLAGVRIPKRQCTRSIFPSIGTFV